MFTIAGTSSTAEAPATFGGTSSHGHGSGQGHASSHLSRHKHAGSGSGVGSKHGSKGAAKGALSLPPSLRRSKLGGVGGRSAGPGTAGALDSLSGALDTSGGGAGSMLAPGAALLRGSAGAGGGKGSTFSMLGGSVVGSSGASSGGAAGSRAAAQLVRALTSLEEAAARRSETASLLEVAALERAAKAAQASQAALARRAAAARHTRKESAAPRSGVVPQGPGAGESPAPLPSRSSLQMEAAGRRLGAHVDLVRAVAGLCGPLEFLLLKAAKGCEEEARAAVQLAQQRNAGEQAGMGGEGGGSLLQALARGMRQEDSEHGASAPSANRALAFARKTSVAGALAGSLRAQGMHAGRPQGGKGNKPADRTVATAAADAVAAALLRRAQQEEAAAMDRDRSRRRLGETSRVHSSHLVESKGGDSAGSTPPGSAGGLGVEERKTPGGGGGGGTEGQLQPLSTGGHSAGDAPFGGMEGREGARPAASPKDLSRPALVGACLRLRGALGAAEAEAGAWRERAGALERQAAEARRRAEDQSSVAYAARSKLGKLRRAYADALMVLKERGLIEHGDGDGGGDGGDAGDEDEDEEEEEGGHGAVAEGSSGRSGRGASSMRHEGSRGGEGSSSSEGGSRQAYRRYREEQEVAAIARAGGGARGRHMDGAGGEGDVVPGGWDGGVAGMHGEGEDEDEEEDDFDRLYPPEYAAAVASVAGGHHPLHHHHALHPDDVDEYAAAAYGLRYVPEDDLDAGEYEQLAHQRYEFARAHAHAHALAEARARLEAHQAQQEADEQQAQAAAAAAGTQAGVGQGGGGLRTSSAPAIAGDSSC